MSLMTGSAADELPQAAVLSQLDASSLVDGERLEAEVKAVYRHVARGEAADLHFTVGRGLASNCLEALEAQGLHVNELRKNDYCFISERALDACRTYQVESVSRVAQRRAPRSTPRREGGSR